MRISTKLLLISFLLLIPISIVFSQEYSGEKTLPIDQNVRIGKLKNGFTYYIMENKKPEKRVEMRLVVNAGSILEDDDQQGLAHFVEHMAFNGTEHFEKNELKNYLESIGIRFGPELNAYTSFEETVYMLTIPSDSTQLLEKGFLVMEDWAHGMTLEEEEIDKERGVIIEEWRIGRGWSQRMRDEYWPVLFKNSKYAERLPIGKKKIIETCSYEALRRFYKDWYRPDLMALVVVGDIDIDYAEEKIINHFSKLEVPEIIRERSNYDIPDTEGTMTCIVTDKEAPYNIIYLLTKDDAKDELTYSDFLEGFKYNFVTAMLNRRLAELTELEQPPFITSSYSYGSLATRSKNAFQGFALVSETGIKEGMEAILTETQRVDLYGYTEMEFERYKLELLKLYEHAYNERDKTESKELADEYKRNFLQNEPIPGIEFEYNFVKNNLNRISLTEVNDLAKELISDENRVIIIMAPENPDIVLPQEDEILAIAEKVIHSEIEPYSEGDVASSLMSELPEPGKILKESEIESIDAIEFLLSNGVRVILKPTDFKNDEVLLTAFSMGGHSVYADEDHFSAMNADGIVKESGVSDFSKSDISKILAGKSVYVAPAISYDHELMTAHSKTADIESMFQLLHLYFTEPRVDQAAFNSYISKKKDMFENLYKEPTNYFFDKYYRIKAQDHPRGNYLPEAEDWDKVDFKRSIQIYRDRFADAENFTFIIVGAFDIDTIRPLLEQYVASLPGIDRIEKPVDLGIRPPSGKTNKKIYKGTDPKSFALIYFEKEMPWNEKDAFLVGVLSDILSVKYIDVLREEMSGVYSVRAQASFPKIPYSRVGFQIMIPCAPENADSLIKAAIHELALIQQEGVDDDNIQKARETRRRTLEVNLKNNKYWLNGIQSSIMKGTRFESIKQEECIELITSEEMQRIANTYFDIDKYLEVVLYPEMENAVE